MDTVPAMPASEQDLFKRFEELGIETNTVRHPPAFTVDDNKEMRGALPGGLGAFVSLIATLLILCYQGFIARVTLETPLGPAVSIVVIDLAVSIGLNFTGRWFYG